MAPITPEIPAKQTAIIAGETGEFEINNDVKVMPLEPDAVIVKTKALALNPVDTKMIGPFACPGAILGFDVAGDIVAIGSDVKRDLKIGDRICASADGMNHYRPLGGAFAEYVSLPGDLVMKLPETMTYEQAAPFGTALASAGLALYWSLKIPASLEQPAEKPFWVLVNGGASSVGTMTIQLAKLSGCKVITTCSTRNFDLCKSYGADYCFDYKSATCAADIKALTKNALGYAVDCITQTSTIKLCYAAIGRAGGKYTALDPYPESGATRKVVKPDWILATTVTGRANSWPEPYGRDGDMSIREFANKMFATVQQLLNEGKLKAHPQRLCEGGFKGILEGVDIIRRGEVSGEKLVYTIA